MTDSEKPDTPPPPSPESALAELTRASSVLESAIATLQQRAASPQDSRPKHTPSTTTVVVDGLTTARHLLTCIRDDIPTSDGRAGHPGGARQWGLNFPMWFKLCIAGCDAVSKRVGAHDDGAASRDGGMDAVKSAMDRLEEGLRLLVRAGNLNAEEQDKLLGSREMEDLFMQLARCPKKLGEKRDGGGLPALLRIPLRWVGSLGGSRGEKRGPEQEESSADLVRVRTWPPGLGRPSTDPELREARKWSRAIGKQIAADRFDAKWHMLSVLLFSPYCRCWTTDHETKVRLIDGLASQSTNMKLEAASKVHLPGVREAIRRNILREAERLIRSVSGTGTLGEEVSGLCSGAVSAIRALGSTLDEDMGRLLGDLWKTGRFQEGLREKSSGSGPGGQNDVLISAINRASAKDYAPTLADYRRFWVDHRFVPLVGTFKFDIDPVSIRIFDPQRLRDAEKTRKLSKEFWAESTSILVPIDLAQYEVCRGCWAEDGEPESGRLAEVASNLSSIAQYRQEGHPLSFIVVLMNVEGLRAKLDQIPFLSIYPDYKGRPDSPDDVVQYTIDRLCAACDTSDDKERMPIESYYHVGEPWEESTLKYILTALKASKTIQDLVGMGVVKMGKE